MNGLNYVTFTGQILKPVKMRNEFSKSTPIWVQAWENFPLQAQ